MRPNLKIHQSRVAPSPATKLEKLLTTIAGNSGPPVTFDMQVGPMPLSLPGTNRWFVYNHPLSAPWPLPALLALMSSTTDTAIGGAVSSTKQPPHVLVFPYPAQGHTLPLLDLTHRLSLHNLTITIITTPKNLPTLSLLLSSSSSNIRPLIFPFPSHPLLPPGVENVKELGNAGNLPIIAALSKLHGPIVQWFNSHPDRPVALISDFFLGWTIHLASHLSIPRFVFFSSGAFSSAVIDYCWNQRDSVKELDVVDFVDLPKTPSFKEKHLPSGYRNYKEGDPDWEIVRDGLAANFSSFGAIINTFEGLEGEYLDYMKRKVRDCRVYGVGPVSLLGPGKRGRDDTSSDSCAGVFDWLDGCPDGSVLYVCFGSQKLLSKAQMEALADGLEKSMVRFVWVVKMGNGHGSLPEGSEELVVGRGWVIRGWAEQVRLLGHRAVGAFLSHCGWNSLLEGLVGGVMFLAWPMEADQFIDARLLVEDLGVGVAVCEGADTVPDPSELAKVIAASMGEEGVGAKLKAQELKDKALAAVRNGGSSLCDLDRLVKEIYKLQITVDSKNADDYL